MKTWPARYGSITEFYDQVYSEVRLDRRRVVDAAQLFTAAQTEGDWSDAATPELGISTIVRGSGRYTADLGASRFRGVLQRHETIVVAPATATAIERTGKHDIMVLALSYREVLALAEDDLALPRSGDFGAVHSAPLREPLIAQMIERLWQSARQPSPTTALLGQGALLTIAALLANAAGLKPVASRTQQLAAWQLRRVTDLVMQRMDRRLTLSDLAGAARLSSFHFARAFKASTGATPLQYVIGKRIEMVKMLLETTDRTVTEIAAAVGYDDPASLARLFRKQAKLTPEQYRRVHRS